MRLGQRWCQLQGSGCLLRSNPRFLATAGSFANCLDFPRILSLVQLLYCAVPLDLSVHS